MAESSNRRIPGERVAPLEVQSLAHGRVRIPDPRHLLHLQFRRFAGCPVCNLHLMQFARAQAPLAQANVRVVAFFHSPAELMRPYQGQLPFPTIPDPDRDHYRTFGVERSMLAVANPRVMVSALRGLFTAPANPLAGGMDQTGLPADFLVGQDGVLLAAKYGSHADDHWSVEEVLGLAADRPRAAPHA